MPYLPGNNPNPTGPLARMFKCGFCETVYWTVPEIHPCEAPGCFVTTCNECSLTCEGCGMKFCEAHRPRTIHDTELALCEPCIEWFNAQDEAIVPEKALQTPNKPNPWAAAKRWAEAFEHEFDRLCWALDRFLGVKP